MISMTLWEWSPSSDRGSSLAAQPWPDFVPGAMTSGACLKPLLQVNAHGYWTGLSLPKRFKSSMQPLSRILEKKTATNASEFRKHKRAHSRGFLSLEFRVRWISSWRVKLPQYRREEVSDMSVNKVILIGRLGSDPGDPPHAIR